MRLLYVIDSLAPGGAETSLAEMAPALVSCGLDLHVLPLGPRLDLAPRLRSAGAQIHAPSGRRGRFGNAAAVREVARSIRPDLIHTTLYEADVAGRTAAWSLRIPVSTSLVNDAYGTSHYGESSRLKLHAARAVDAGTALVANRFHAITTSIADSVAPRLAIPRSKIDVIPRGRDPVAFPFRPLGVREATRSALGISPEAPVILSIGRLEPQKGHAHLLRALPLLAREHPEAVVLIAGKEGRASASLRELAERQSVEVRFLGHRDDVAALLSAADVFCFPSEREGFGGVLLESMAVGCPIVASDIPTSREVLTVENGTVGILCPHLPQDLSEAIGSVLKDDALSAHYATRARGHFLENYSLAQVTTRMSHFFISAMQPHASARRRAVSGRRRRDASDKKP